MASTERPQPNDIRRAGAAPAEPGAIQALTTADLAGALHLSAAAQWNQSEADWRHMLAQGQGWAIHGRNAAGTPRIAASTVVLPYGTFAWISMVLVLPELRRRGYATQLLRHALAHLAAKGLTAVLDATSAGRAVYSKQGFGDTWGFARYRREARAAVPPPAGTVSAALTRAGRSSRGAPQRMTIIATAIAIAVAVLAVPISKTDAWRALAEALIGLG